MENSVDWSGLGGWELVCLQFNDAAQLDIDGVTRLSATRALDLGLGYREICKAVQLVEVTAKPVPKSRHTTCVIAAVIPTGCNSQSLRLPYRTFEMPNGNTDPLLASSILCISLLKFL